MKRAYAILSAVLFVGAFAVLAIARDAASGAVAEGKNTAIKMAQSAATNSSLVAVDPKRRLAFVARKHLGGVSGDGLVDVINLAVNPNKKDPRKATLDIGHADIPSGVAVDAAAGELIVVSGHNGHDGTIDLFRESDLNHVGGKPFPAGSDTGSVGQAIFDPVRNKVVVATITTGLSAGTPANATTGFALFDMGSMSFGPIIPASASDNFAFNAITNVVISPADDVDPPIDAVDIANGAGCTSDPGDTNLQSQVDSDGAAFDPATNVVVVADDSAKLATVMNLNGSTFADEGMPPCTLLEGGAAPNSVNIATSFIDPAGVAVNLKTHQALLEQTDDSGVALIQLPTKPVTQIDSTNTFEISEAILPDDPAGNPVRVRGFPYSAAIDSKRNLGYGDHDDTFLIQISLKTLMKNPSAIGNGLPTGNCKGTSTTLGCSNGGGITFFPLSDATTK